MLINVPNTFVLGTSSAELVEFFMPLYLLSRYDVAVYRIRYKKRGSNVIWTIFSTSTVPGGQKLVATNNLLGVASRCHVG